jgi:hypothetical protein
MVLDSDYESKAAKPPISLHPAFPAIVALWFAALLGIGSLVLPAVLLDRLVSATGIGSLITAANPPLGMTARSIIAVVGALAGAGLGIAIARRVAQAHEPENESRVAKLAGGSRRPISVHDELGGEGVVNGESLPINRRRALAISEDDRPSDFLYRAPLPGEDPDVPAPFAAAPIVSAEPDAPLELSELAQADSDETDGTIDMIDTKESPSSWPTHQHYPREPEIDERENRNNFAGPRGFEPLPFAAPSLARRAPQFEAEPEDVQLAAVEVPVETATERTEFRADWETAPLDGLGLVQLVQRLGSTIDRRRELMAQVTVQPLSAPARFAEDDFEPAAAEDAVQAMAAFFGSAAVAQPEPKSGDGARENREPAPHPEFLHPLSLADEEDPDGMVPDFSLPLRRPVVAAPACAPADNDADVDADTDADTDEDEVSAADTEEGYSSLLSMSNPFAAPKSEFVRIEEPEEEAELTEPAVVFPGQDASAPASGARPFDPPGKTAAPDTPGTQVPADADAALRSALATLQRMSGAA